MSATVSSTVSPSAALQTLIRDRSALVGVIGLGYVGLPLALTFVEQRFRVLGFDIDPARRNRLNEIGGRPANSIAELAASARCIIIARGSPSTGRDDITPTTGRVGLESS